MRIIKPGVFIVVEGIDGAGKSTLVESLKTEIGNELGESNVFTSRDPGSTPFGEALRGILKSNTGEKLSPVTMLLSFCAVRRQLVDTFITPRLESGHVVICDRFMPSAYAYQGRAGGLIKLLGQEGFASILNSSTDILPNLNIVLKLPVELAKKRLAGSKDPFDAKPVEYFETLARAYSHVVDRPETFGHSVALEAKFKREEVVKKALRAIRQIDAYKRLAAPAVTVLNA